MLAKAILKWPKLVKPSCTSLRTFHLTLNIKSSAMEVNVISWRSIVKKDHLFQHSLHQILSKPKKFWKRSRLSKPIMEAQNSCNLWCLHTMNHISWPQKKEESKLRKDFSCWQTDVSIMKNRLFNSSSSRLTNTQSYSLAVLVMALVQISCRWWQRLAVENARSSQIINLMEWRFSADKLWSIQFSQTWLIAPSLSWVAMLRNLKTSNMIIMLSLRLLILMTHWLQLNSVTSRDSSSFVSTILYQNNNLKRWSAPFHASSTRSLEVQRLSNTPEKTLRNLKLTLVMEKKITCCSNLQLKTGLISLTICMISTWILRVKPRSLKSLPLIKSWADSLHLLES